MKIILFYTSLIFFVSCTVSSDTSRGKRTSTLRKTMHADAQRFMIQNILELDDKQFELLSLDQESSITEGDGDYLNQQTIYSYKGQVGLILTTYNTVFKSQGGFDNLHFTAEEAIAIEEFIRNIKVDLSGYTERYIMAYQSDLAIEIMKKYGKIHYVFWDENKFRHGISANDWKDRIQKVRNKVKDTNTNN